MAPSRGSCLQQQVDLRQPARHVTKHRPVATARKWVVSLAIGTGFLGRSYGAQSDLNKTLGPYPVTIVGSADTTKEEKRIYNNLTEWIKTTTCVNGDANQCTFVTSMKYPDLGICAFQYYRLRLLPFGSDASNLAGVSEMLLWYKGEVLEGASAILEGKQNVTQYPTPVEQQWRATTSATAQQYSDPARVIDGTEASWIDLDMNNMIVFFQYQVLVDEACISLNRNPPTGIQWALDGAHSIKGPWYIRLNTSLAQAPVGKQQCYSLTLNHQRCEENATLTNPHFVPQEWQLVDNVPMACMEQGACGLNGTCAPYNAGRLCHQCAAVYGGRNGTRWRTGDKCEACPEYWEPVVKSIAFLLLYCLFAWWLMSRQYWESKKPWTYAHALELEWLMVKDEPAIKPLYAAAIMRLLLEHQVLVAAAWEESGLFMALPQNARSLASLIVVDWFKVIQVQCVFPSWEVPDQNYCAHVSIFCTTWLTFMCIYLGTQEKVSKKGKNKKQTSRCGWWCGKCCKIFDLFAEGLCTLFKCIFCCKKEEPKAADSGDGDRDKDEDTLGTLATSGMTRAQRDETKKPDWWEKGPPTPQACALAGVIVINFLQLPLFYSAFIVHLDCVNFANNPIPVLRVNLEISCQGDDYHAHVVSCVCGLVVWKLLVPLLFAVAIRDTSKDWGNVDTKHSAYNFMLAGLRPTRWWFSLFKMAVKESIPVLVTIIRIGGPPQGPGNGNAPGVLILLGLGCAIFTGTMQPYDSEYPLLHVMEMLSWVAFCFAPITRLLLGLDARAASYIGQPYIARFVHIADTGPQWLFLVTAILLHTAVPLIAATAVLENEHHFIEPPRVDISIHERVHIVMPAKESHRRAVADMIANLFRTAIHGHMDHADKSPGSSIAPSALLESVLIVAAKNQAKDEGVELGTDIGIEKSNLVLMGERIESGEETDRLVDHRAVLEPGGYAEATLGDGKGKGKAKGKKGKGKGKATEPASPVKKAGKVASPAKGTPVEENEAASQAEEAMPLQTDYDEYGVHSGLHTFEEHKVIMFSFAIECVELKSLGFRAGEGKSEIRQGVRSALARGVAAAGAATETDVDIDIHPVGMDRALVLANVRAPGGTDETVQLRIREEWLRNTLGSREGRTRWGKAVEQDLQRVGCVSMVGQRLQVRFTRGSRPQTMAESLAAAASEATIAAASAAAWDKNPGPQPVTLGRIGNNDIHETDEYFGRGEAAPAESSPMKGKAAQMRAKATSNDEGSNQEESDPRKRGRRNSRGPRKAAQGSAPPATGGKEKARRRPRLAESAEADFHGKNEGGGGNFAWNMV